MALRKLLFFAVCLFQGVNTHSIAYHVYATKELCEQHCPSQECSYYQPPTVAKHIINKIEVPSFEEDQASGWSCKLLVN